MKNKIIGAGAIATLIFASGLAWARAVMNVDQKGLAFSVSTLRIKKGDVVNFTNSDRTSHNILVLGEGVRLNSGLQAPGVVFRAPFHKSGAYRVMCGIHPRMKIAVTVR